MSELAKVIKTKMFPLSRKPRRTIRPVNRERASWAMKAVECFMEETGLTKWDGLDTAISDLLADLMHLCDKRGLDFDDLVRRANNHYDAEQSARTE